MDTFIYDYVNTEKAADRHKPGLCLRLHWEGHRVSYTRVEIHTLMVIIAEEKAPPGGLLPHTEPGKPTPAFPSATHHTEMGQSLCRAQSQPSSLQKAKRKFISYIWYISLGLATIYLTAESWLSTENEAPGWWETSRMSRMSQERFHVFFLYLPKIRTEGHKAEESCNYLWTAGNQWQNVKHSKKNATFPGDADRTLSVIKKITQKTKPPQINKKQTNTHHWVTALWSYGESVSSFRKYFSLALAEVWLNYSRFSYYPSYTWELNPWSLQK